MCLFAALANAYQDADELFERAAEYQRRGAIAAAERAYERALAADPSHFGANHNLGDLYARSGRLRQAASMYRRALAARPSQHAIRQKLVWALLSIGRGTDAIADAERLAADDDSALNRVLLARALRAAGRTPAACEELVRALAFDSRNSAVQMELAECFVESGDRDAAFMHARAIARREPAHAGAARLLTAFRVEERRDRWSWLPSLVALGALAAALGARGPDRRPQRWIAVGVLIASVATLAWLVSGSQLWLVGAAMAVLPFRAAFRQRRAPQGEREAGRAAVLSAAGTVLGCVAQSDGAVSPAELRAAREGCAWLGFSPAETSHAGAALQRCVAEVREALAEHESLLARLHRACAAFAATEGQTARTALFRVAVRVASSNGPPEARTLAVLSACAAALTVPADLQDTIRRELDGGATPIRSAGDFPAPPESPA